MSGYNAESGIFELNEAKASRYLRLSKDSTIRAKDWRDYCSELFERAGFEVLRKTPYGIEIVADDADVWQVLSGTPATWGRASPPASAVYARWLATREWFNATALGKELSPPLGPVRVNKLLEDHGYQVKNDGMWAPTPLAEGFYEMRMGAAVYGNEKRQVVHWRRSMIDVLASCLNTSRGSKSAD